MRTLLTGVLCLWYKPRMFARFLDLMFGLFGCFLVWDGRWLERPRSFYTLPNVIGICAVGALIILMFYGALSPGSPSTFRLSRRSRSERP